MSTTRWVETGTGGLVSFILLEAHGWRPRGCARDCEMSVADGLAPFTVTSFSVARGLCASVTDFDEAPPCPPPQDSNTYLFVFQAYRDLEGVTVPEILIGTRVTRSPQIRLIPVRD